MRIYLPKCPSGKVWTGIPMNVHFPAPRSKWPSRLVNLAVAIVVLALAAATFALSYSGVHAIVLQAGVSARLARIYPGLFDAVFLIACVAAVVLRDARWWARWYAWLVVILMVAVVGAADAVYAMNVSLPHRTMEGVVAAAPWVLVLLGFSLMLTVFRQSRVQHATATATAEPAYPAEAAYPAVGPAQFPEASSAQETRALPVGVWVPEATGEPEDVAAPQAEAGPPADLGDTAGVDAPRPDTTDMPVAQDTDEHAVNETAPVEPVEEEPVTASAADEEPAPEPEPAAEPVPEPAGAAYQEDSTPTTPYNYWDSGVDSGFNGPDRVPTLPGGVPTVPGEVIDEDAPPFATAPFAAVPRLNRVRSTPTPPEDDDEEE
jgi:Protein of unknown function (DUF2637)